MTLRPITLAALLALAAAPLAGCGKLGDLERPGPIFGAGRNTTKGADETQRQAQDPNRQVNAADPRQRYSDPAPERTIPIEGSGNNPMAPGPQGSNPDPYANPR